MAGAAFAALPRRRAGRRPGPGRLCLLNAAPAFLPSALSLYIQS